MKSKIFAVCCACAALTGSGCLFNSKEVSVSYNDSISQRMEYYNSALQDSNGLALESVNFLRGNLMLSDLKSNSMQVLKKLNEFYHVSHDPKYLIVSADLCRYLAAKSDGKDAIQYNLSSFFYCIKFVKRREQASKLENNTTYTFSGIQCIKDYNQACSGIFSYLKERNLLDASAVTLNDKEGHKFILAKPVYQLSIPREAVQSISLCSSYTVKNLMQLNRQPGVGVPLVAEIKMKKWYSSLKTPVGLTIPVTLLLRCERKNSNEIILRPIYIDTYKQENYKYAIAEGKEIVLPLAHDFSTPLACFLDKTAERNLLAQMLNPFEQEATDGLYMIEPYQAGKIPVVFIHGLMSSPETWVQLINSLKNDPNIRKRYQFWFFSYSTGAPVGLSALKLQKALLAAQKEFCTSPEATANFNKMVLVGHSMGGLLTRLSLQKKPHYVFETMFQQSWDQIRKKLQPEDFKLVESFVPTPLPFVHRAVFMAVPHKGANMAKSPIAKLGICLIELPAFIVSRESTLKRIIKTLNPKTPNIDMGNKFYTGIDSLVPDNQYVRAVGSSPMKEDLTYHSVIGNISEAGSPDGSDGVVPYWSSHLDNAASELIVQSNHSVHRRPAAIQEVLRILLLHLNAE